MTPDIAVHLGDCLDVLADLPDASIDAVVTDPPYLLGFMGREWDTRAAHEHLDWHLAWCRQAIRVLKPGGHLLAFGGTRTYHRLTCAVEDAGFEIRDSIAWLYGAGFPKSLNLNGEWQGWGTALKPAHEPIVVARKPLAGTVAANVTEHGTGALNIDGCRVAHRGAADLAESMGKNRHADFGTESGGNEVYGDYSMVPRTNYDGTAGRWPANVVLDEHTAALVDEQSGTVRSAGFYEKSDGTTEGRGGANYQPRYYAGSATYADHGGASRFFYVSKAAADERIRHDGTAHPTVKPLDLMRWLVRLVTPPGGTVLDPFAGSGTTAEACLLEGFDCIAVEREADYLPLIHQRLNRRRDPVAYSRTAGSDGGLFDLLEDVADD